MKWKCSKIIICFISLILLTTIVPISIIRVFENYNPGINSNNGENNSDFSKTIDKNKKVFYPSFLKKITSSDLKEINSIDLFSNESATDSTTTSNNFLISTDFVKNNLSNVLFNHIKKNGYQYLLNDVKQFMHDFHLVNSYAFSFADASEPKINSSDNSSNFEVIGEFSLKNKTLLKEKLFNLNRKEFSELKLINPKEIIHINFWTDSKTTIHPILLEHNNSFYVNWVVSKLFMKISSDDSKSFQFEFNNFIFNNSISHLNIHIKNVTSSRNPYFLKTNIVGENKFFNLNLFGKEQIQNDLDYYVENSLFLSKKIATSVRNILQNLIENNNHTGFKLVDLISNNALDITNLLSSIYPLFNERVSNNSSIREFIFDLLTNYSKNPNNRLTLYDFAWKHRVVIFFLLANKLSNTLNYHELTNLAKNIEKINSSFELFQIFQKISFSLNQIFLDASYKPLQNLISKLVEKPDTYLMDFLSDKENDNNIIKCLISNKINSFIPLNDDVKELIKKYSTLLIDLMSSKYDDLASLMKPFFDTKIDESNKLVKNYFLKDILNLSLFPLKKFNSELQEFIDNFLISNINLVNNEATILKINNLLIEICNFLNDENLNKITIEPINSNSNFNLSYSDDKKDIIINDLNIKYKLSFDNLFIKNSLINAIIEFFPDEPIKDVFNKFITVELRSKIKETAYKDVLNYFKSNPSYSILDWFVGFDKIANSIVYGKNNKDGITDVILDKIYNSLNANSTIKNLAKEILFGSYNVNLNDNWLQINGSMNINYLGSNLYVLPTYIYDYYDKLHLNYQIINLTQKLDTSSFSKTFNLLEQNNAKKESSVISAYDFSKQLHDMFVNFVNKSINYFADHEYEFQSNIYLTPTINKNKFVLNTSKINVKTYVPNYWVSHNESISKVNYKNTQNLLTNNFWNWNNNNPELSKEGHDLLDNCFVFSDQLLNDQSKYTTSTTVVYGIPKLPLNLKIIENVYLNIYFLKYLNIPINLSLNFEWRRITKTIIFPYPVYDKTTNEFITKLSISFQNFIHSIDYKVI